MDGANMTDETTEVLETAEELQKLEIDAREIERQMVEAAQARAQDPSEMAAQMYAMYVPHFKNGVKKLSTRGLRRVLLNAVLYPLEQDDIKASSEFEKQMVQLVSSLLEAKFILIMDQYRLNAEQLYEAATTPLTHEQENEVKKQLEGENNG
jgi:hypothetical protein